MKILRHMLVTWKKVYKNPVYVFLLFIFGGLFLSSMIWLPNFRLFIYAFQSPNIDFVEFVRIFFSSLSDFFTNYTVVNQMSMLFVSLLIGVYFSLLTYQVKQEIQNSKYTAGGIFGIISGLLGVGCSSCGSILFASLVGVGASVRIINFLPLHGLEFSFISIMILGITVYYITMKIGEPMTCHGVL